MMIGGKDLVIATPMSPETQVLFMTRYLRHLWGNVVIEHDGAELFCYPSEEAKQAWDNDCNDDYEMVHLLPCDGCLTIVHEKLDEDEVRNNFNANRCFA